MNFRRYLVSKAERRQYTSLFKFKYTNVNLPSCLNRTKKIGPPVCRTKWRCYDSSECLLIKLSAKGQLDSKTPSAYALLFYNKTAHTVCIYGYELVSGGYLRTDLFNMANLHETARP